MRTKVFLFLGALLFMLSACQAATPSPQSTPSPEPVAAADAIEFPKIDRHPAAADYNRGPMTILPTYDPESGQSWQMDLRSFDLTALDLRDSLDDLLFATFDDRTVWPAAANMPEGFDSKQMMELGKNPGLGIRTLHDSGITGENIGIAIIDQTLLVDHQEYVDRIRLYEEAEDIQGGWLETQMHGPAVASIAVGKTVGAAPGADLYFIASAMCSSGSYESIDFSCLAESMRRVIQINKQLPSDRKIRVLSMSIGWGPESKGYDAIQSAVREVQDEGIFIVCSSESDIYGFRFHGLGRNPLSDPDGINSYEPGSWWAKNFFQGQGLTDTLLIPMDSRTTASPTGTDEYVFYREGGWSWSIPYIAGVYVLAAQVKPDITPEVFWSTALQTGRTIEISHEGQKYSFGLILDPVALIHALQNS